MAVLITKCPHCRVEAMAFTIFGAIAHANPMQAEQMYRASVAAECNACRKPIAGIVETTMSRSTEGYTNFVPKVPELLKHDRSLSTLRMKQVVTWPSVSTDVIPEALPEAVERSFRQAEVNFQQPNCEEAAATMYRRSLDVGLKLAHPELKGSLEQKITKLVANHNLPSSLGDWAHAVRLIGNDGAHDVDGVTREELEDARAFIDTVLRYMFTLPARITARSGLPAD